MNMEDFFIFPESCECGNHDRLIDVGCTFYSLYIKLVIVGHRFLLKKNMTTIWPQEQIMNPLCKGFTTK